MRLPGPRSQQSDGSRRGETRPNGEGTDHDYPLVVILGLLAFGLVRWGKQKISGLLVGILLGLALASTAVGPPILDAVTSASRTVFAAISSAVR